MSADLIERLRKADVWYNRGPNYEPLTIPPSAVRLEAADALAAKEAALSEMRAELERVKKERDEYRRKQYHVAKDRAICYVSKDGVEVTDIFDLPVERMPNGYDFAEELAAAEAKLERARKALEPFADARGHFDGHVRDDDIVPGSLRHIRAHHVIAAARAASQDEGEER